MAMEKSMVVGKSHGKIHGANEYQGGTEPGPPALGIKIPCHANDL